MEMCFVFTSDRKFLAAAKVFKTKELCRLLMKRRMHCSRHLYVNAWLGNISVDYADTAQQNF
jgi:hypothetical protein